MDGQNAEDFLTTLKNSIDKLGADNARLTQANARIPELELRLATALTKISLIRKPKPIEELETVISILEKSLENSEKEIIRLQAIIDNDKNLVHLKLLEDWLYAAAEKLGVKSNMDLIPLMRSVSDAIRKLR